ncbi:MAG TPA: pyruvate formate lyase family protein, partial [Armatimonadota bacterium]|nr:pyruvate formate lyase family protein [Armatimonadota bacterium]
MTTVSFVHHSLSPQTHQLADEALAGHWGRTLADLPLTLDGTTLTDVSDERLYAECVTLIAEQAQVRIIPGERLVGSASLALAPKHVVPVYRQGKPIFPSTSHLTLGFDYALKVGYRGLRAEINERLSRGDLDEKGCDLLHAMLICLNSATRWHQRYVDALTDAANTATGEQREHYQQIIARLRNVPENPPTTFPEAVQSLWFMFAFQRLCGNWPGIGRIDEMLGSYLRADLAAKTITLNEARELLAHFWIMGCEWIGAETSFGDSGDAQHYQNIVLSGVDADGHDITNDVTYLILDIVEELHISDFPIAVRINRDSPDRLLRRIAEVQRCGGGIVAIYNEETVLDSMVRFGYPLREARRFANDGCWEVQIPGETCFTYRPFDTLALLQEVLGVHSGTPLPCHDDFASFYTAFRDRLFTQVDAIHREADGFAHDGRPATLVSLLERDCIEQGRGYYACGARYTLFAPHAGGIPDTANSLLAIKQLVYDEQ